MMYIATVVERQRDTMHPNPGPIRHGKAKVNRQPAEEKTRWTLNIQAVRVDLIKREKPIVCWNLQHISFGDNNKARLKKTTGIISEQR